MRKILQNKKFILTIIFIIYLMISFLLVLNHEIWTDEAQAWEIARSLSVPEIFAQMRYEAHPCLWHLILAIPAKLGLPVISMNIISWICTSIAVYIILFHSKFNSILKIFIIFNPTFIYLLSVVSRNYCLIVLLLSIFSIIYEKRMKHPILYTIIIGLLSQTHIIICGFIGISALIFLIELFKEKRYKNLIISIIIFFTFFILLAAQIFPSLGDCVFIQKDPMTFQYLINKILICAKGIGEFFIKNESPILSLLFLIVILVIATKITYNYNKQKGIMLLISISFLYIIHLFWPFSITERTSLIFAIIVLLNTDNDKKAYLIFTIIISSLIILTNYNKIISDFKYEYSDSKNVGNFINENIEDSSLIIILDIDRHVSAIPYIDNSKNLTYYNIQNEAYQTFMTWNKKGFTEKEYYEIENQMAKVSKNYKDIYILYGSSTYYNDYHDTTLYNLENNNQITKIYETPYVNEVIDRKEIFKIYRYRGK